MGWVRIHPSLPRVSPRTEGERGGAWSSHIIRGEAFPWSWGVVYPFEWLNRGCCIRWVQRYRATWGNAHNITCIDHNTRGVTRARPRISNHETHEPGHRKDTHQGIQLEGTRRDVRGRKARRNEQTSPRKRNGTVASVSGKRKKKDLERFDERHTVDGQTIREKKKPNVEIDRRTTHTREVAKRT